MHASSTRRRILGAALAIVAIGLGVLWLLRPGEAPAPATPPVATEQPSEPAPTRAADPLLAPRDSDVAERTVDSEPIEAPSPSSSPTASGVLAGRVAFADGSIPPPILLRLERWDSERGSHAAPDSVVKATGCRSEIYVTTDVEGRFEVSGLCPGSYRASCSRPETIWADGLFEPPTRDALYVLQGYLLIARVVDANRTPVAGARLIAEWLQDPDENRPNPRASVWNKVTSADGTVWVAAPLPGDVTIRPLGLGADVSSDTISLRMTPGVVKQEVWWPTVPSRADLRVQLTACGDSGRRLRSYCFRLIVSGSKDPPLRICSDHVAKDGVVRAIPAGRYRFKLLDLVTNTEPGFYFEGPETEWDVELRDGEETLFARCAELGGRFRAIVRSDHHEEVAENVQAQFELLNENGELASHLGFRESLEDGGVQWTSTLPFGVERDCNKLLKAGEYTVRVGARGHRDQLVHIVLKGGEITPVAIQLESDP
jgi:hypothetical protein